MSDAKLSIWDFLAIGLYFAAVIAAGLYAMCRSNRSTVSGYFLAGRFMTWLPVGASLFASNIGSEHFIGLAGSGAAAGIAVGAFELNSCLLLQLLGWIFLPVYIASGVCTLPEYMKKRFGGKRIRIYLATLSLTLYIFTKISVNLYSGALFIQQALHWDLYVSVILLLAVTAITTVTGGLAAVIYTDTLQAGVMVIGAFVLMILSLIEVGGYSELHHRYMSAVSNTSLANPNDTCGLPREDSWTMFRDPVTSDMPWPGFLLGQTPASIWYWCADQMMVQRTLAAKSLSHAQGGTLFAGYLKLLPVFLLVIPGMISRVLFPDEVACSDPDVCWEVCGNRLGCSNIAYPKLILTLMPTGMKGVMLSVMLAALMSDLTSIFNSASTLFTMDIYRYIRKTAANRELMIVGRVFVCIMVVIGILWIPVIQGMQGAQLYIYIQSIAAYLAPPIACVYLLAVLWKRGNEMGAFWGLMVAMVAGVTRMILGYIYPDPGCGDADVRPYFIAHVHYMYFALFLFLLTGTVMISVSLLTEPPSEEQTIRTTYWTRMDIHIRNDEVGEVEEIRSRHASGNSVMSFQPVPEHRSRHASDNNGRTRHMSHENGSSYMPGSKIRHASGNGSLHAGRNGFHAIKNGDATSRSLPDVEMISFIGKEKTTFDILNEEENSSFLHPTYDAASRQGNGTSPRQYSEVNGHMTNGNSHSLQYKNGTALATGDVKHSVSVEDRRCHCDASDYIFSVLRHGAQWFCGLSPSSLVDTSVMDDFSHRITSFKQSKRERVTLTIGLVILICLDLLLFVFFCTGSDFGLVHDAHVPSYANESFVYNVNNTIF